MMKLLLHCHLTTGLFNLSFQRSVRSSPKWLLWIESPTFIGVSSNFAAQFQATFMSWRNVSQIINLLRPCQATQSLFFWALLSTQLFHLISEKAASIFSSVSEISDSKLFAFSIRRDQTHANLRAAKFVKINKQPENCLPHCAGCFLNLLHLGFTTGEPRSSSPNSYYLQQAVFCWRSQPEAFFA